MDKCDFLIINCKLVTSINNISIIQAYKSVFKEKKKTLQLQKKSMLTEEYLEKSKKVQRKTI